MWVGGEVEEVGGKKRFQPEPKMIELVWRSSGNRPDSLRKQPNTAMHGRLLLRRAQNAHPRAQAIFLYFLTLQPAPQTRERFCHSSRSVTKI